MMAYAAVTPWQAWEDETIVSLVGMWTMKEISELLDRSHDSVKSRLQKLRVRAAGLKPKPHRRDPNSSRREEPSKIFVPDHVLEDRERRHAARANLSLTAILMGDRA